MPRQRPHNLNRCLQGLLRVTGIHAFREHPSSSKGCLRVMGEAAISFGAALLCCAAPAPACVAEAFAGVPGTCVSAGPAFLGLCRAGRAQCSALVAPLVPLGALGSWCKHAAAMSSCLDELRVPMCTALLGCGWLCCAVKAICARVCAGWACWGVGEASVHQTSPG